MKAASCSYSALRINSIHLEKEPPEGLQGQSWKSGVARPPPPGGRLDPGCELGRAGLKSDNCRKFAPPKKLNPSRISFSHHFGPLFPKVFDSAKANRGWLTGPAARWSCGWAGPSLGWLQQPPPGGSAEPQTPMTLCHLRAKF